MKYLVNVSLLYITVPIFIDDFILYFNIHDFLFNKLNSTCSEQKSAFLKVYTIY